MYIILSSLANLWLRCRRDGCFASFQGRGVGRKLMVYTVKAAKLYRLPIELTADPDESCEGYAAV